MAETQVISWDQVNVDESISDAEQASSNDISNATPVGKFLCTIMGCDAIEKSFSKYNCIAANMKMRIDQVINIEQVIFDDKGKAIVREGEPVKKVQPVPADKAEKINALYVGRFVFDEINLLNVLEKEAMKNRRLFVAKKMRLITSDAKEIKTAAWAGSIGRQVIVETEWNSWKDKVTGEMRKNVKVGWSGYDFAPAATVAGGVTHIDSPADTEEFDI